MEADLDNTYNMMMIKMTIMIMMMIIIALTPSIFKLGPPHFAQMMTMKIMMML